MAKKTQKQYENDIVKKMKALKVYKPEFELTITGLAKALVMQDSSEELFEKSGGQIMIKHTNKAGATNAAKNPFYLALETLRQDIIIYLRELGLTPSALKRINESSLKQRTSSPLSDALAKLGK